MSELILVWMFELTLIRFSIAYDEYSLFSIKLPRLFVLLLRFPLKNEPDRPPV
jgi:hypothetical protein